MNRRKNQKQLLLLLLGKHSRENRKGAELLGDSLNSHQ
jgi:hypothetical protein